MAKLGSLTWHPTLLNFARSLTCSSVESTTDITYLTMPCCAVPSLAIPCRATKADVYDDPLTEPGENSEIGVA